MTRQLGKQMLSGCLIVLGLSLVLGAGLGCGSSWPKAVNAGGEDSFLNGMAAVQTIDLMPSDLQVWAHGKSKQSEEEIGSNFDSHVAGLMPVLLSERGYRVVGNLDWQGGYVDDRGVRKQAMNSRQMVETAYALSSYGPALARARRADLVPHLPHRLGESTGADATLYIGGWGYAGVKPENKGAKVLKTVAVVLVVAVVVVAVAAVLDGKGGKIGNGLGKVAGGVAKGAAHAAKASARVAGGIGRATIHVARGTTRVMAEMSRGIHIHDININNGSRDSFGRIDTHVSWYTGRPNYYAHKETPSGGKSAAMIEMTLVDNRRGLVLWHARQRFPASPAKPGDIQKMLDQMIAALPVSG